MALSTNKTDLVQYSDLRSHFRHKWDKQIGHEEQTFGFEILDKP